MTYAVLPADTQRVENHYLPRRGGSSLQHRAVDIAAGDHSLFESGAILIYLADKTGRFMPASPRGRYAALQWLMFQMGHVGPMLGRAHHFRHHHFRQYAPEKSPYAVERYTSEAALGSVGK